MTRNLERSKCQGRQRADDAGDAGDVFVDELADVLLVLDVDLHQQVVFAAGRIEFGDQLGLLDGVGNLVGLAGRALQLDEYGLHGKFLKMLSFGRRPVEAQHRSCQYGRKRVLRASDKPARPCRGWRTDGCKQTPVRTGFLEKRIPW